VPSSLSHTGGDNLKTTSHFPNDCSEKHMHDHSAKSTVAIPISKCPGRLCGFYVPFHDVFTETFFFQALHVDFN